MKKSVLNDFKEIYSDINNLSSYKNYYNALRLWVKSNEKYFVESLQFDSKLRMLLDLDENKYLVEEPEISLSMEKNRLCKIDFSLIDTLLRAISNTLWDMVTIRSDRDCPHCQYGLGYGYGDLHYIKAKIFEGNYNIILECNICGKLVNLNGSMYEGEIVSYYPACKEEIVDYQ